MSGTQPLRHHICAPGRQWSHCCVCGGHVHLDDCTKRRNRQKDCCPARHKMLYDAGELRGVLDSTFVMWSPDHPLGYHDPI